MTARRSLSLSSLSSMLSVIIRKVVGVEDTGGAIGGGGSGLLDELGREPRMSLPVTMVALSDWGKVGPSTILSVRSSRRAEWKGNR